MGHAFFHYHAKHLAIDPARPWQVCTEHGCLVGRFATEQRAGEYVAALCEAKAAGTLPTRVNDWDRYAEFQEAK